MAEFTRDGITLRYEVLGGRGPWIVLTPGGRQSMQGVEALGRALTLGGYRVLLHDRRNCGGSDVYVDGDLSEQEVWVDDVHALMQHLGTGPAIAGGGSAGCRLSLLLALRYPEAVRGLLLWYVTGGRTAAEVLGHNYYGQFILLAESGGMGAVCESEFFAERIAENPSNRARLESMTVPHFVRVMRAWQQFFTDGADLPVIGATREELGTIGVPTCIIPGADEVHPRKVAEGLNEIIPDSEFQPAFADSDVASIRQLPPEAIMQRFARRQHEIFSDFLRRRLPA